MDFLKKKHIKISICAADMECRVLAINRRIIDGHIVSYPSMVSSTVFPVRREGRLEAGDGDGEEGKEKSKEGLHFWKRGNKN